MRRNQYEINDIKAEDRIEEEKNLKFAREVILVQLIFIYTISSNQKIRLVSKICVYVYMEIAQ